MADNGKAWLVGAAVAGAGAICTSVAWCLGKSKGHAEGVGDGYVKASKEYEQKLLAQADEFLRERNRMAGNSAEKDKLIQELLALLRQTKDVNRQMDIQMVLSRVRAA